MIDLKINDKGDLVIKDKEYVSSFKINFFAVGEPVMKINFITADNTQDFECEKHSQSKFRIRFRTNQKDLSGGKLAKATNGKELLRQLIMTRLRTEQGDCCLMKEFGSKVHLAKHKDIMSDSVRSQLENNILSKISDLLENPEVVIAAEESDDFFYCQNLNVYIYDGEELIYEFQLNG